MSTPSKTRIAAALSFSAVLHACGGGGATDPVATVPGAPTIVSASAGNTSASIAFTAPASNGGASITVYTAACVAAGVSYTGTAAASPISVAGLSNGTTYSCAVTASNAVGAGTPSAALAVIPAVTGSARFKGEVWVDNWFALYVGEQQVAQDSVPITTERSFNSESFTFNASYPFDLNFIVKDYIENDSGLEYIGKANQQIGDGGFIAQITDTSTGKVVAVSNSSWKCSVIHKAPLNKTCEHDANPAQTCLAKIDPEPAGWKSAGYDVSAWESATEYTEAEVGVKEGYYDISWNASAKPIWTSDLKADNTLLCKLTVTGP